MPEAGPLKPSLLKLRRRLNFNKRGFKDPKKGLLEQESRFLTLRIRRVGEICHLRNFSLKWLKRAKSVKFRHFIPDLPLKMTTTDNIWCSTKSDFRPFSTFLTFFDVFWTFDPFLDFLKGFRHVDPFLTFFDLF